MAKYPIYNINIRWTQDTEGELAPYLVDGLPVGRMRNAASWETMYREARDLEEIKKELLLDWWPRYKKKGLNPSEPDILVTFERQETWCPGWFCHWTFDTEPDDATVCASFDAYVERMQESNYRISRYPDNPVCLMGAEDRWRWHGTRTGDASEHTEPPCRCEHCRKRGVVVIGH